MGRRNYLIDGVSCSGKTSVATELQRRGYQVIHGDRELKYRGDRETGTPVAMPADFPDDRSRAEWISEHLCWPVGEVQRLVDNKDVPVTFFCGGSRNTAQFIDLFDGVFVLDIDAATLTRRLDERPEDEWGGRGRHAESELFLRLHDTKEDVPAGHVIDATQPLEVVVGEILRLCQQG